MCSTDGVFLPSTCINALIGEKKEPFTWASMSLLFLRDLLQAQSDCSAINYCRILAEHLGTFVGKVFQLLQKLEWLG